MSEKDILVKTGNFPYRVLIEKGALSGLGKAMRLLFPSERTLMVSDENVYSLYGEQVLKSLKNENWQVENHVIVPGENSKNLTTASRIYDAAVDAELDRNSPVIALGGGVVGDLGGFIAATYLRGVPLVMVPTSLLAQVDSSIGGKVAVNHPRGKNIIGSIYPPRMVLIDPEVLDTLPRRHFEAGMVEIIKYGIIENADFFYWLEENLDSLMQGDGQLLAEAVAGSIRSKARVVEADEFEKDYRRILNFGHTLGHALEAASGFKHYLHGEAVLVGMIAALDIALALNVIKPGIAGRITRLILKINPKKAPAGLTAERVIDKLRQDKKRIGSDIIFVLPDQIGSAIIVPVNDENLLNLVLNKYLKSDATG